MSPLKLVPATSSSSATTNSLPRTMATSVLLAAALFGCAGYSPKGLTPGASEADVMRTMGQPTGRYTLPNGNARLEFARGPAGRETYMVDFDRTGKMIEWEQVMDLWHLTRIEPGMSIEDLLMRVGHPGSTQAIKRQQLVVWNYRYPTNDCLWYQVSVGDDGKVITGSQGIDPQCDAPSDGLGGRR